MQAPFNMRIPKATATSDGVCIKLDDQQAIIVLALLNELRQARANHPQPIVDLHHALGILEEEFHEFRMELFKRKPNKEHVEMELLQVAAVCLRIIEDVILAPQLVNHKVHRRLGEHQP